MSAINSDGSLNISFLERQVREDMAIYSKSRAEEGMKKRALHACKDYDDFKNFVSVSQLKPITGRDVSSLFNGSSGLITSFRNRTVHGASAVKYGIGCLEGCIEKKKDEVIANDDSKKNVQMTPKRCEGKAIRSSTIKSSRDAYSFLARWKRECSSSASDALLFLAQMEELPEKTCHNYFATDIDSDVVGDIICALHLLMCIAMDKNGHNDNLVAGLISTGLLNELNATTFTKRWLKALTGCGRFDLALSFLTTERKLQLKEVVDFVKESVVTEDGDEDYLRRYNNAMRKS